MQSEGGGGCEGGDGGVYTWREEGVLSHAHTHTRTQMDFNKNRPKPLKMDGFGTSSCIMFVLRKQVLFNK